MSAEESDGEPQVVPEGEMETGDIFEVVRRHATSSSADHQRTNALLEAVTLFIGSRGEQPLPAAYYSALMLSLEQSLQKSDDADQVYSTVYLLSLVFPTVSRVLQSQFGQIAPLFEMTFTQFADNVGVIKAATTCVATLVREQPPALWESSEVLKGLFNHLLELAVGQTKPRIRRAAQAAVVEVVQNPVRVKARPAGAAATLFCVTALSSGAGETNQALYVLSLIHGIIAHVSSQNLVRLVEAVLAVPKLGQHINTHAMKLFKDVLLLPDVVTKLKAARVALLVGALAAMQPSASDPDGSVAYVEMMAVGMVQLHVVDPATFSQQLPLFVDAVFPNLEHSRAAVVKSTVRALKAVFAEGIDEETVVGATRDRSHPLWNVVATLESGLTYRFKPVWGPLLEIIAVLLDKLGGFADRFLADALRTMAEFNNIEDFAARDKLHEAIGMAIRSLGPQKIADIIPIDLTRTDGGGNDWMMPLLRKNVRYASLNYFADTLVPLAHHVLNASHEAEAAGMSLAAKALAARAMQVWDLLPAFCILPTDLAETWPVVGPLIGKRLNTEPGLRDTLCLALANLIRKNRDVARGVEDAEDFVISAEQAQQNCIAMAADAARFLPLLFNLFTETETAKRNIIAEAIRAYASIADEKLVNDFFKTVAKKLLTATTSDAMSPEEKNAQLHNMTELALALVVGLNEPSLGLLYQIIVPQLRDPDATLQKKSYRVLAAMCEASPAFVHAGLADLRETLMSTRDGCRAPAKGNRLRCFASMVHHLPASALGELFNPEDPSLMAEIILSSKEASEKARDVGEEIIAAVGAKTLEPDAGLDLRTFLTLVVVGLGGTDNRMISATIVAIARIFGAFADRLTPDVIEGLVPTLLHLLRSPHAEIVRAAVRFAQVVLKVFPVDLLEPYLKTMVDNLLLWVGEQHQGFRTKLREIFERMLRKIGYERLVELMPSDTHRKFLDNVRKDHAKKQKQHALRKSEPKKQKGTDEFDMSSSGGEDGGAESAGSDVVPRMPKRSARGTVLMEGAEDAVDLLDPSAARHVISGRMRRGPGKSFDVSKDGRFLIPNEDGDIDEDAARKADPSMDVGEAPQPVGRKRRRDDDEEDGEDSGDDTKSTRTNKTARSTKSFRSTRTTGTTGTLGGRSVAGRSDVSTRSKFSTSLYQPSRKKARVERNNPHSGEQYRARKAVGDVKKEGKMEPYTYFEFDRKDLNKRHRGKSAGKYENIVNATKKAVERSRKQQKAIKHRRSNKGRPAGS